MFPCTFLRLSYYVRLAIFSTNKLSWIEVRTLIFYFLVLSLFLFLLGTEFLRRRSQPLLLLLLVNDDDDDDVWVSLSLGRKLFIIKASAV